MKENRGIALAKQQGEGIPRVFQPPAAPSPSELWLPPSGSSSFSSYPPPRAVFIFYFQFPKFSSFPMQDLYKFVHLNSFHSPLLVFVF